MPVRFWRRCRLFLIMWMLAVVATLTVTFFTLLGDWAVLAGGSGKIAFSAFLEGNWEIVVTDENGQHMENLSKHSADDCCPVWSPDGRYIAFVSNRDGNPEIYIMDSDGSSQRRITKNPLVDIMPSFAPDGRRLLFTRMPGVSGSADVFFIDIDGRNEKHLTDGGAAEWSPDGKRIALSKKDHDLGNWEIYLMDADGKNQVNVTRHPAGDLCPAWSPDGRQIVFKSDRANPGFWDIYKMDSDGQNVVRLMQGVPLGQPDEPTWSPDGQYIAFYYLTLNQIVVAKADGSNLKVISEGTNPSWFDPAFARQYMVNPAGKLTERWGWLKRSD